MRARARRRVQADPRVASRAVADYSSLRIDALIVHEVPTHARDAGATGPTLSEVESPMTTEVRNFFEERLRATLSDAAFPALVIEGTPSPVPGLVEALLAGTAPLVEPSQKMAERLFEVQTGVNSPGLLAVARGRLDSAAMIAIVKLEKEHGVRVRPEEIDGLKTLSVEHIKDLMLTEKTRVFKTGLFSLPEGGMEIVVCDYQRQLAHTVAGFFLRDFLGCGLAARPDVDTRTFMRAVESWINRDVESPEDKSAYAVALITEMNSQRTTITPASFAETHLKVKHRRSFLEALKESEAPTKRFVKDTSLVENQLRRIRYDVDTGAVVIAPPETIGESVNVVDLPDGRTQIQVDGHLNRVEGKRR